MTTGDASMLDIVRALRETYRDDGIAIVLASTHRSGPLRGRCPIDLCCTPGGRRKVLDWAESLTGMVAT